MQESQFQQLQPFIDKLVSATSAEHLTVLAALLTAFAAVVISPLITRSVTTRQIRAETISTNRQAWINSLRDELAKFLSLVSFWPTFGTTVEKVDERAQRCNLLLAKIRLRLNPDEGDHVELIRLLGEAVRAATATDVERRQSFVAIFDQIVALSQTVLKREWIRVKGGR
ncbi:MAG: hypothetical protein WA993_15430 [Candidatus Binatus sp.]